VSLCDTLAGNLNNEVSSVIVSSGCKHNHRTNICSPVSQNYVENSKHSLRADLVTEDRAVVTTAAAVKVDQLLDTNWAAKVSQSHCDMLPILDTTTGSLLLATGSPSVHVNGFSPLHDATNGQSVDNDSNDSNQQVMPRLIASSTSEQTLLELLSPCVGPVQQQMHTKPPLLKLATSSSCGATNSHAITGVESQSCVPVSFLLQASLLHLLLIYQS
jgi:hypothetical protein